MEFLDATGGGKYPKASPRTLVRLSEFSEKDQRNLATRIQKEIINGNDSLALHELDFIDALNCSVTLVVSKEDESLVQTGEMNQYECRLSKLTYQEFVQIILHASGEGYNWLTPGEYLDEPAFLISKYGTW